MRAVIKKVQLYQGIVLLSAAAAFLVEAARGGEWPPRPETLLYCVLAFLSAASALMAFRMAKTSYQLKHPAREPLKLASFGVTERQRRLALGYVEGKTMKTLAIENGISCPTVRSQMGAVYAKLEISGGAELRVLAERFILE